MPKKPRIRSMALLGWALWDPARNDYVRGYVSPFFPRVYATRLTAENSIYYSPTQHKIVRVKQTTSPL